MLAGALYARYYDLPPAGAWAGGSSSRTGRRGGKRTAEGFAELCAARAREAQDRSGFGGYVAASGAVLEQAQFLTTHHLAVLVDALDLEGRLQELAADLADRAFSWAVTRLGRLALHRHAALQAIKNAAYAWRQAIFFLSFADQQIQQAALERLTERVDGAGITRWFAPAVDGLAHVVAGGRFTDYGTVDGALGRRFLGWTTGQHWCLAATARAGTHA